MGSVTRVTADSEETTLHKSVVTTKLDQLVNWARSGSLWPLPFGTACCAIEFMSVVSAHYDISRFGAEVVRFSPRQSDVLIVAGTVTDKQSPILKQIWEQMAEPKWCIAMGVCASSGGFYRAYHVTQGIDEVIPVDVYVPGCPPTPEGLIYAVLELQRKIRGERRISEGGLGGRKAARRAEAAGEAAGVSARAGADRAAEQTEPGVLHSAELLNDPGALSASVGPDPRDRELARASIVERVGANGGKGPAPKLPGRDG
jgi:NADH-quinone oxidoreductase subunit B